MAKSKAQHFRDAIIIVTISIVVFLIISAWHIILSLKGINLFMGMKIIDAEKISVALLFATLSLAIAMIYLTNHYLNISRLEKDLVVTKISNENAQNTIRILKAHQHDFLNHLQVILGYIQFGNITSAINYIRNINNELTDVRIIGDLQMYEVAVLLFIKKEEALKNGINVTYNIKTDLSDVKINQYDLVRILANLIDNAIYELKKNIKTTKSKKLINIIIDKVGETLFIEVHNFPGIIRDGNKIFEYGYSTKGEDGSGIGLFTVKNLVEKKYQGKIEVKSSEKIGTSFTIAV